MLVAAILVYLIMTETDIDCGIVCNPAPPPPHPLSAGGGEEGRWGDSPTKFSKMGGLTGPYFLEEGCWESGGDFFQGEEEGGGGCNFLTKNKLKSGIFNDKKSL